MDKCLAGAYSLTCDHRTSRLGALRTFRVTDLRACQSQLSRRWPFRTQQCRHPARSPTTRKNPCSRDNGPLRLVLRASIASSGCAKPSSILTGGSTLHTLGCLRAQGATEHCRHCVETLQEWCNPYQGGACSERLCPHCAGSLGQQVHPGPRPEAAEASGVGR